MKKSLLCLLLFASVAVAAPVPPEQFVTDQLVITLRESAGEGAKALGTLRTGTPLQILQEEGNFLRVRTGDGVEGYVLRHYVTADPPKPLVIARLEKENATLKSRLQELQATQAELDSRLEEARRGGAAGASDLAALQQELSGVQEAYRELQEKSANVRQLDTERAQLQQQNAQLLAEVETLREENDSLLFRAAFKWFLAGGGVLLVGWFLGRRSQQKRRGYSF